MKRSSRSSITWVLLVGFTLNALVPSAAQAWMLCIGCGDFGMSVSVPGDADRAKGCCPSEVPESDPEGRDPTEWHAEDCVCVDLTVDLDRPIASLTSHRDEYQPLSDEVLTIEVTTAPGRDTSAVSSRGPPDPLPSPGSRTLFGQRTLLLI